MPRLRRFQTRNRGLRRSDTRGDVRLSETRFGASLQDLVEKGEIVGDVVISLSDIRASERTGFETAEDGAHRFFTSDIRCCAMRRSFNGVRSLFLTN